MLRSSGARLCHRRWLTTALEKQKTQNAIMTITQRRRAETRRFGAPILHILGVGVVGVGLVAKWYYKNTPEQFHEKTVSPPLEPNAIVTDQNDIEALLSEVRVVLGRFGISLGRVPLRVSLLEEGHRLEGMTTKVLRPPPLLRGVEGISLKRNLTALTAAQVLAHEYTHAWLWLQGFPALEPRVEEGLCELLSYLFLLSCLREPDDGAVLARDPNAIRAQILSIEANAHPDYGGGFRDCVEALRGRKLHELLGHVREHARLPPPME